MHGHDISANHLRAYVIIIYMQLINNNGDIMRTVRIGYIIDLIATLLKLNNRDIIYNLYRS